MLKVEKWAQGKNQLFVILARSPYLRIVLNFT